MTVNCGAVQYVGFQDAFVNALEGFWASLERGINGTDLHVSPKHLGEFEYRHSM